MKNPEILPEMKTAPAVFAVNNTYQIMVPVKSDVLFWINIDGCDYYDHSNGIIRSNVRMHRVSVPMEKVDNAGKYTVCYRRVTERKPYFSVTEDVEKVEYKFYPLKDKKEIHIYHLADTHGNFNLPAQAAEYFGEKLDLLILNGDIPDHSGNTENFDLIYELCSAITGGSIPCVFSRGNHDTRGFYAENIADYTPNEYGNSYFTFRLGPVWGIVLDCGEDKDDSHPEYGNTVCCRQFRREESEFLQQVAENGEYTGDGIIYRLAICHTPFMRTPHPPFDIEVPLYKKWTDILGKKIKPDMFIAGHLHRSEVWQPDGEKQPFPVIIGAEVAFDKSEASKYIGAAITLKGTAATVEFTDSDKKVIKSENLNLHEK